MGVSVETTTTNKPRQSMVFPFISVSHSMNVLLMPFLLALSSSFFRVFPHCEDIFISFRFHFAFSVRHVKQINITLFTIARLLAPCWYVFVFEECPIKRKNCFWMGRFFRYILRLLLCLCASKPVIHLFPQNFLRNRWRQKNIRCRLSIRQEAISSYWKVFLIPHQRGASRRKNFPASQDNARDCQVHLSQCTSRRGWHRSTESWWMRNIEGKLNCQQLNSTGRCNWIMHCRLEGNYEKDERNENDCRDR